MEQQIETKTSEPVAHPRLPPKWMLICLSICRMPNLFTNASALHWISRGSSSLQPVRITKWLWMKADSDDHSALRVSNTQSVNSNFSGQLIKLIPGWWSIAGVWEGWRRIVTRNGRKIERLWEKREAGDEEREGKERKNGPIPGFGLETLITQDHRLWQSNLLGCCLKNNHKHPSATHKHTSVWRKMGIKCNAQK